MEGAAACHGQTDTSFNPAKRAKLPFWWGYHITRLWGLNFSAALTTGTVLLVCLVGASDKLVSLCFVVWVTTWGNDEPLDPLGPALWWVSEKKDVPLENW